MDIYSVVNVDNLKLFEPYMLTKEEQKIDQVLSSVDDLAPNITYELGEDSIL